VIRKTILSIVAGAALGLTLTIGAQPALADFCTEHGCKSEHIDQDGCIATPDGCIQSYQCPNWPQPPCETVMFCIYDVECPPPMGN
jgi:hypothetical protein